MKMKYFKDLKDKVLSFFKTKEKTLLSKTDLEVKDDLEEGNIDNKEETSDDIYPLW
jgi:hypothetical protein